jgi:hypothetical protein
MAAERAAKSERMNRRISAPIVKRTLFIQLLVTLRVVPDHRGRALSMPWAIGASGFVYASVHKQARNDVDAQGEDHRVEGKGEQAVQ